jgi:predicted deacylase
VERWSVAPGTRISATLPVEAGAARTEVPVTVLRGATPGPTLVLLAGVHGYEYVPLLALQQLRAELDPASLSGTLVLVHAANPPAFFGRSVYGGPVDGLNLNRAFPGDADGSLTERIAARLVDDVITGADFLVDLHAGDGNEALRPYVYVPRTGNPAVDEPSRALAVAFGLDHAVIDSLDAEALASASTADATAWRLGIPAITTETGQQGQRDPRHVALAVAGVRNVLRSLGMLPGAVTPPPAIVWLEGYEVVTSPADGVFFPAVDPGWSVAEGAVLGRLVDLFGEPLATLRAPFAGIVTYVVATPPLNAGDPVAMVARRAAGD